MSIDMIYDPKQLEDQLMADWINMGNTSRVATGNQSGFYLQIGTLQTFDGEEKENRVSHIHYYPNINISALQGTKIQPINNTYSGWSLKCNGVHIISATINNSDLIESRIIKSNIYGKEIELNLQIGQLSTTWRKILDMCSKTGNPELPYYQSQEQGLKKTASSAVDPNLNRIRGESIQMFQDKNKAGLNKIEEAIDPEIAELLKDESIDLSGDEIMDLSGDEIMDLSGGKTLKSKKFKRKKNNKNK
jgi:hypothetical protein